MSADFKKTFQTVRTIRTIESWTVYIATALLLLEFLASQNQPLSCLISSCQIATCVFAVISMILSLLSDHLLYQAEEEKRKDLLDNAFGSHLSEMNTSEYYTNDSIPKGIKKLAVNNFESAFFTKSILAAGLGWKVVVFIVVLLIFIIVSITASREAVILVLQLTLPVNITIEFVRFCSTYFRVNKLYQAYRILFDNNRDPRTADLLLNVMNYTAALSYGKTLLDEKKYKQMNASLSADWERIRMSLNLE